MRKQFMSIFISVLVIATTISISESLQGSTINSITQKTSNTTTLLNPASQDIALIFGKITDLQRYDTYIRFQAVQLRVITFSPVSFTSYSSEEYFEINKAHLGLITKQFIFSLTTTFIPTIDCSVDDTLDRLVIVAVDTDVKWKNIEVTTDNSKVAWRVYTFEGTPVDGWNSTASAITNVNAGDYLFIQFNETTPPTDVNVTFSYTPTASFLGIWAINV